MSSFSLFFFLLFATLLSIPSSSSAQSTSPKPFRAEAFVLQVTKDQATNQYITTIQQRTPLRPVNLTVDIGGKSLWMACNRGEYVSSTYRPAICNSPLCRVAQSNACFTCWDKPRPGCSNGTCNNVMYNTVERSAQVGELGTDVLLLQSTDGFNPGGAVHLPNFLFSCGSLFFAERLANGVKGIVGFGRTDTSFPSLLSSALGIPRKFAACLSSSKGVVFVGNGPYVFLTIPARFPYTPFLINPVSTSYPLLDDYPDASWPSIEYFIGVESIKIDSRTVQLSSKLLQFDAKGRGGTKISSVQPYTVLHTSIYNAITKAFTKALPKVPRVGPVGPFETCYKASSLGMTRVGPAVPYIELKLRNNVTWTIYGRNSMVYVNNSEVACLAFVNGGKKPRTSIVIGGHQMEDNLLEFDIEKSRLGISPTLFGLRTTCDSFNFTSKALWIEGI